MQSLKTEDDQLTDPKSIVDALSNHFSGMLSNSDGDLLEDPCAGIHTTESVFQFSSVMEDEVSKLLLSIDVNKAIGVDGISGKMLRVTASEITQSLTSLFDCSLSTGVTPFE